MLKVLDLFAGEGGASAGYVAAGLSLLAAVDTDDRALRRHQAYERELTWTGDWAEGLAKFGAEADLIHASPPCQRYAVGTKTDCRENWPDLVVPVRKALLATGKPFVIENVDLAPLENPVYLTGCMFGLTVTWAPGRNNPKLWKNACGQYWKTKKKNEKWLVLNSDRRGEDIVFHLERKRGFEVHGFTLTTPAVTADVHKLPAMPVVGGTPTGFWNQWYRRSIPGGVLNELMETPWMSRHGCAESIPPAYTKHIGTQFSSSFHRQ